jgi:hypothetical protein
MVDDFNVMREAINSALDMITKTSAYIHNYQAGETTASFTVSAPADTTVVQNGTPLTGINNGNRQEYSITVDLEKIDSTEFTVSKGTQSVSLTFGLGAKLYTVSAQDLSSKITVTNGNGKMVDETEAGAVYQVAIPAGGEEMQCWIDLNLASFTLYDPTEYFKLRIYNYGDTVTLQAQVSNEDSPATFRTFKQDFSNERKDFTITLQSGWNTVEMNVWGMVGKIDNGNYINGRYGNIHTLRLIADAESDVSLGISKLVLEV